jgi:hypothetical protein
MHRLLTMKRLSVLFLCTFAVLVSATFAWQALVKGPEERCEAKGRWWDAQGRTCAQPISVAEEIERLKGLSRAEASDQRNRELIAIEDQLAAQKAARDADANRQRAALAAATGN